MALNDGGKIIIPYSKLVGRYIYELENQTKIGSVADLIIEGSEPKIAAFVLESLLPLRSQLKVISSEDVVGLEDSLVYIKGEESIIKLSEVVKLADYFNDGLTGIGQEVVTRDGQKIGKVADYLVDSETLEIRKIYAKSLLNERVISSNEIYKIEKKKIIINDNLKTAKLKVLFQELPVVAD